MTTTLADAKPAAPYQEPFSQGYPTHQQAGAAAGAPWPPDDPYVPNTPLPDSNWSAYSASQGGQYPTYDDEPPKRSFWRSFQGIVLMSSLLLMVLGVSGFAIYFYPSLCSLQERKGLRQDMPLPCGITFQDYLDRSASGTTGPGSNEWVYSVDNSSAAQLKAFYHDHLPKNGWGIPPKAQNAQQFPDSVLACKGDMLAITHGTTQTNPDDNITPPPGSILLLIIFVPVKNLSENFCASP